MGLPEKLRDWQDYAPALEFCALLVVDAVEAADEIERLRDECISLRLTIEGQQEQAMVAKKVIESLRAVRSRKHGAV